MMTIEQALALTPGGFKLMHFAGDDDIATWRDRNGNQIYTGPNGVYVQFNGDWSDNLKTINEACAWLESKKKWWGK